jgi:C1A family cysteine protease
MKDRRVLWFGTLFTLAVLAVGPVWTQDAAPTAKPAVAVAAEAPRLATTLPERFDLRDLGCVTPIKAQQGGTCWTHGTMAALESHMLMSGFWKASGEPGYPALSEYHLDWWNGFNKHKNTDLGDKKDGNTGLTVHQGGDYRVAAAYFSRGDGIVLAPRDKDNNPDTKSWYKNTPPQSDPSFKRYYVRDIEWFVAGENLENIDTIKRRIMTEGAIGTAYCAGRFTSKDNVHYQPRDNPQDPNHSVAIVGWDDTKISTDEAKKAPKPGAWLIKNSWGEKRGDKGYYWISYYDKHSGRHPEMGAVSFRNIEPMMYTDVYYHDYHGWRDELPKVSKAFNAFTATGRQSIRAVSFYTVKDNVSYVVKLYGKFENGQLSQELTSQAGSHRFTGFHTVNLSTPVWVNAKDKFYVCLELSDGGQAIDRTSIIPVLLGQEKKQEQKKAEQKKDEPQKDVQPPAKKKGGKGGRGFAKPKVASTANPGESYYYDGTAWRDLYDYVFATEEWNHTANFCIKALAVRSPAAPAPTAAATATSN